MSAQSDFKFGWKPVPRDRIRTIIIETCNAVSKLNETKGYEYSGDEDALENFRRNGFNVNLEPEVIWSVYAAKHWDAIMQWVQDILRNNNRVYSEPITGRIDDLITYLILLKALYQARMERDAEKART